MVYGQRYKEMIMGEFKGTSATGDLTVALSNDELHILINLVEQLLELLGERNFIHHYQSDDPFAQLMAAQLMSMEPLSAPEDPVLNRLLPNAYADPDAADEFRKFTEPRLRQIKQQHLMYLREQLVFPVDHELPKADISISDAQQWLLALNDLRLALAVRLEVEPDTFEKFELMPDSEPKKSLLAVYFWLGGIQEKLLDHL